MAYASGSGDYDEPGGSGDYDEPGGSGDYDEPGGSGAHDEAGGGGAHEEAGGSGAHDEAGGSGDDDDGQASTGFPFSMFGYGSPPKCLKLWKMIYMPLQSLYLDLANGLSSADTMLRSIIRSCDSYKDIFIPKKEGTVDADNYTDFTTWLLGRLFYLMIMKELRPLFDVSVEAQVEILKLLEQNRNVFFNAMCAEYAEVLLDVTNAERLFAQDLQLKRFIPRENDSLAEFIDLTQVRVIVNTSEMRRIFQCQALKVLKGIIMLIPEHAMDLIGKIWNTLRVTCSTCYFDLRILVIDDEMTLLRRGFFMSDESTGKEFCTDFDNFIGNLEDVSFGFPFEDSENLFHLLKTHIFQIKASTLTGSELLAAMLFKTMKKLITKWKDGIYPDYVGDAAAVLALFLLNKYKNLHVEDRLIGIIASEDHSNLNVIHILEWAVYEEVATFLAKIGSTFMGTTYAFKGHNVNYERFGDMKNQNLFSIVVQQFFHKSSKKETDSEKLENVDIYDDTMESDEGSSSSHSLSESKNSSGEDSDYIEISSPISETRLPQSPKVQPVYTKSPDNNDYPLADLTSSDEMTEVQPGDSQSPDNNDYPFSDPSRDDDLITMGIPEMANTGGTFTFELAGNSQDSNIMGVPALTSCDDIIKNRVPKLISDLSSTEDEKSSSVEILDEVISPMLETSVRLHRYYKNLKEKHKTEKDQHPLKEANRLVYYHKSLERQMSVVKESPVFKAIRSLSLKSSKPQKPHFSKQVYNVLEVISEEYERCAEQVKSSVENVEKFVKKTDIKPASETTVKDPIPQKRPRKFITLHKTGPHKTVLVDEANEGEPSKKDSVKIAKPHDAHPVAGEGFQESIESKKFHFMMNVKPGTSKDPDPVLQNLDSPDTEDDFQLRMISQDTSEKCINIYCYVASSTWCNLLTRFETNLVALPYAVEATQVNSLLEDIEKIVHCSLELSLMLENNFHELMPWHAYAFILFNKIKVKMAESFSQLFVQLSDEIGQERIISRCLNLVGRLFHLSEVRRASHDDVVTLALFVALPWMDLIEEDRSVGCEIVERCRRNTSLRGEHLKCLSFRLLIHLPHCEENEMIWEILENCLSSLTLITMVLNHAPILILEKKLEPLRFFTDFMDVAFDTSINEPSLQLVLSATAGRIVCALAGNCNASRYVENNKVIYTYTCVQCSPEMITSKPPYKNQIEGLNPHLERYLELLESEDSGVLDNMISNLEQFNRHISGFTSAESIDRYFKFITDSDMKRRLKFASLVQYVIFEHCWLRHKMFEIQAVEDPFLLCDHDKMEFKRAMPLLEKCLFLLNEASITSLQKKLGKLQRTLIVSITALGSVPMDCVLLPCVSLLFMFIQHPLSVTLPIAMNGLNRIIEERGMTAVQIYVRFKPEICNLMADFIVLNHIMGGSAITTSIQRLVRALGFENLRDFLQKDAHNFLPYLLPSSMKSSQTVRLLEGLGQSMMVDMKVLFEKTFQYVYPHVFLTCDERTRQRCFRYIERVTETSLRQLRLANFKMIHNELLLRYCDNPDQALAALCQFAHDDEDYKIEVEPMSLSDIASYLNRRFLGVMVYFDSKLLSMKSSDEVKMCVMKSLPLVLSLMGKQYITPVKFKVLATLRTAMKVEIDDFPALCMEAWQAFVRCVDLAHLGPLLPTISASLLSLLEPFEFEVQEIFNYLIVENRFMMFPYIQSIYFIEEFEELKHLSLKQVEDKDWFSSFIKKLRIYTTSVKNDNVDIKLFGLKYLKSLLLDEPAAIKEYLKEENHVHPGIREALDALCDGLMEENPKIKVNCIECIGLIGAIDPTYLFVREFQIGPPTIFVEITDKMFCVAVIEHLAKQFQSSCHPQSMDAYALGIQLFLKKFEVSTDPYYDKMKIWDSLTPELREIAEPLLTSCYKNIVPVYDVYPHPVRGSVYGRTFSDWARSWTLKMLSKYVHEDVKEVFELCLISIKRDLQTLLFFMPYIFVYALQNGSESDIGQIIEEIYLVLAPIPDDKPSLRSDAMGFGVAWPLKAERTTDLFKNDKVPCSKQVFSLIDFTYQFFRTCKSRDLQDEATVPRHTALKGFLSELDMLVLAKASYICGENTRALLYLEQYVKEKKDKFQDVLWLFLKIYDHLNDPDGVRGVANLRENESTLEETVMTHRATGQFQELPQTVLVNRQRGDDANAAVFYENLQFGTKVKNKFYTGLVECYLSLDQPLTALRLCQGVMKERPELKNKMEDYEAEAFWRMNDFDQLSELLLETTSIKNGESWNISLGHALLAFRDQVCDFSHKLFPLKNFNAQSLREVSIEKGSYSEQYTSIVRSHIIMEIEKFHGDLQSIMQEETGMEALYLAQESLDIWKYRIEAIKSCTQFREPVFSIRRAFLVQAMNIVRPKYPEVANYFREQIGKCWMESAVTALADRQYQQAYAYLLNAENYKVKGLFVEKARFLWAKGDHDMAIRELKRGIEIFMPYYYSNREDYYTEVSTDDQKIYAKAKLLLATYLDETVYVDLETSISNYKEAVDACLSMEKSYVCLAQFYERIISTFGTDEDTTKYSGAGGETQVNIVNYYAMSLLQGTEYLYQSLPCLLTVWFDYGDQLGNPSKRKNFSAAEVIQLTANLRRINAIINELFVTLPSYIFMPAFSQLISRISHPHQEVFDLLLKIMSVLIRSYPQQAMWMTIPVLKSTNAFRARRCRMVVNASGKDAPRHSKFTREFILLADKLTELTEKTVDQESKKRGTVTVSKLCQSLPRFLGSMSSDIMVPLQQSFNTYLPRDQKDYEGHNPYKGLMVNFVGIRESVMILNSLQLPKCITILASNGKEYSLMCKSRDDLRRDFRYMEFSNVVNQYLRNEPASKQRNLHIRTYCVMPLNDDSGIVEWVPDLKSYRACLVDIYKEYKIFRGYTAAKSLLNPSFTFEVKKENFVDKVLHMYPPVFDEWFTLQFPEPHTWYRARTSYIKTTAVMSMIGFILGLGDRHGENILMDTVTGETVHVDFNCLFNKGETFQCPERVPFRLTHNMVAAMGPLGVEGTFRSCCEITMTLLRKHSRTLLSFLRPFIYDPLVSWSRSNPEGDVEYTNESAVRSLENIKKRLDGVVVVKGNECILELSVDGQVNYLISEATDVENLCQMYIGWASFF